MPTDTYTFKQIFRGVEWKTKLNSNIRITSSRIITKKIRAIITEEFRKDFTIEKHDNINAGQWLLDHENNSIDSLK